VVEGLSERTNQRMVAKVGAAVLQATTLDRQRKARPVDPHRSNVARWADQTAAVRENDGLEAGVGAELPEEPADVVPCRLFGYAESGGNGTRPEAVGEERERLVLPCGQAERASRGLSLGGAVGWRSRRAGEPEDTDDLTVLPERNRRDANTPTPASTVEEHEVVVGRRAPE
jgi:hypothetical protein